MIVLVVPGRMTPFSNNEAPHISRGGSRIYNLQVPIKISNLYTITTMFTISFLQTFNEFLHIYTRYEQKLLCSSEPVCNVLDPPLHSCQVSKASFQIIALVLTDAALQVVLIIQTQFLGFLRQLNWFVSALNLFGLALLCAQAFYRIKVYQ